jgi:hypothetical protein
MQQIKDINRSIIKVWKLYKQHLKDDSPIPLFYPPLDKGAQLLSIGLNPSFGKKLQKKKSLLWRNFVREGYPNSVIEQEQEGQREARGNYRYYEPFRKIAGDFDMTWAHVDLFFYRVTKTNDLKKIVLIDNSSKQLNEFGKAQLELSKRLINTFSPQVILVASALGARIFQGAFDADFDNELGCHKVQLNNRVVPVFFSSMLTGGAMDRYSRQRLEWHMARVLEMKHK